MLELLVTIAVMGVLFAVVAPSLNQPRPDVVAASVQAELQRARLESIRRNRPVALVWDSAT